MASPPTKSQSLHNFALQCNKDKDAHSVVDKHHQRRHSIGSTSRKPNVSSSPCGQSLPRDFSQQGSPAPQCAKRSTIAVGPTPPHVTCCDLASESVGIYSKLDITQNPGKNSPKFETKTKGEDVEVENKPKCDEKIEEEAKVWNLRPRNSIRRMAADAGGPSGTNGTEKNKAHPKSGENCKKTKKKLSIAISLSKEEIEEDIFSLTGKKPARRPKKRPRNVQNQLDNLFPGLWLGSISAESYKVSENK